MYNFGSSPMLRNSLFEPFVPGADIYSMIQDSVKGPYCYQHFVLQWNIS